MSVFSILRKNVELYPVTFCTLFGCVLAGSYLLRMAVQHPDAAWSNKRKYLPWNDVKQTEQKRFYSTFDYGKFKDTKPKIEDE